MILVVFFWQTDASQRDYLASVISEFHKHVICTLKFGDVHFGDGVLGRFHVLATTLRVASSNEEHPMPKNAPASMRAHAMTGQIGEVAMSMAKLAHYEQSETRAAITEAKERQARADALAAMEKTLIQARDFL